ncbi:MAG: class F420-dependent oxidoreductase [Frankiales bacterium]|nr:class F420-dependent oxidoreductase [Frankiales bacterium]
MKLGLNLGYWGMGNDQQNMVLAKEAEQLGFSCVWAAEAYGSDTATVLAWVGAQTEHIGLGAGVMQIPGRTPAMTAMTAATLDALSGGRFRLGLGVSGPQVSEGWHGVRFDQPLARTREYVAIVNQALSRQRVRFDGEHFTLPLPDGPGKPLQLTVHPVRDHIPIYLASVGPKNLELTGEIADGWLALFYSAEFASEQLAQIAAGRVKAGLSMDGFDVTAGMPIIVSHDTRSAADALRGFTSLYIGGMGSRDQNFYNRLAVRMGYGPAAEQIQDAYLSRDYAAAAAAVPFELIDATSLIGAPNRISERMAALAESGLTSLNLMPTVGNTEDKLATLRTAAQAWHDSGVQE